MMIISDLEIPYILQAHSGMVLQRLPEMQSSLFVFSQEAYVAVPGLGSEIIASSHVLRSFFRAEAVLKAMIASSFAVVE